MRREMTIGYVALALAALIAVLSIWQTATDPMLFYTPPPKHWLSWGGDAQRIKPYNFSVEWLEWVQREQPWWTPDKPIMTSFDVELSPRICMTKVDGSPQNVCY